MPCTMTCLKCGYVLAGISTNRCPECGRPFDPADSRTFFVPLQQHVTRGDVDAYLNLVMPIALCAFVLTMAAGSSGDEVLVYIMSVLLAAWVIYGCTVSALRFANRSRQLFVRLVRASTWIAAFLVGSSAAIAMGAWIGVAVFGAPLL